MKIKEIKVTRYVIVSDDEEIQYPQEFVEKMSAELAMRNMEQLGIKIFGLELQVMNDPDIDEGFDWVEGISDDDGDDYPVRQ